MSLFKPSAKKVIKTIFSEFTPEEMKILESDTCSVPHMYTTLLNSCRPWHRSKYSLAQVKEISEVCIYPCREYLNKKIVQQQIFDICSRRIFDK